MLLAGASHCPGPYGSTTRLPAAPWPSQRSWVKLWPTSVPNLTTPLLFLPHFPPRNVSIQGSYYTTAPTERAALYLPSTSPDKQLPSFCSAQQRLLLQPCYLHHAFLFLKVLIIKKIYIFSLFFCFVLFLFFKSSFVPGSVLLFCVFFLKYLSPSTGRGGGSWLCTMPANGRPPNEMHGVWRCTRKSRDGFGGILRAAPPGGNHPTVHPQPLHGPKRCVRHWVAQPGGSWPPLGGAHHLHHH